MAMGNPHNILSKVMRTMMSLTADNTTLWCQPTTITPLLPPHIPCQNYLLWKPTTMAQNAKFATLFQPYVKSLQGFHCKSEQCCPFSPCWQWWLLPAPSLSKSSHHPRPNEHPTPQTTFWIWWFICNASCCNHWNLKTNATMLALTWCRDLTPINFPCCHYNQHIPCLKQHQHCNQYFQPSLTAILHHYTHELQCAPSHALWQMWMDEEPHDVGHPWLPTIIANPVPHHTLV